MVARQVGSVGRVYDRLEQALQLVRKVLVASLLVGLHLDLVAGRQERVEAHDQLGVALEEHRDSGNNTGSVNRLRLEFLKLTIE